MAGTFPGVSGTQQQDTNGEPLDGALLTVFNGGTTTLSSVYQDIGLAIPAPNPVVADASGRLPLFFVADGTYRVRLTDKYGATANGGFDYPQVPSIGASSSGGGGSAIDPTTIFSTGDVKWQPIDGVLSGFVRINGRTVGSATSGASERANADTNPLFTWLWSNFADAICPVPGGRGASAAADFAANKQITLLDLRFRGPIGLDTMGSAAAGRSTGATFTTGSATAAASVGGEGAHQLITSEMPSHTHTAAVTDPGHSHTVPGGATSAGVFLSEGISHVIDVQSSSSVTGVTVANSNTGGGGTHNNMPPFMTGTWFQKL